MRRGANGMTIGTAQSENRRIAAQGRHFGGRMGGGPSGGSGGGTGGYTTPASNAVPSSSASLAASAASPASVPGSARVCTSALDAVASRAGPLSAAAASTGPTNVEPASIPEGCGGWTESELEVCPPQLT